jgi:subtilisin family serine protease
MIKVRFGGKGGSAILLVDADDYLAVRARGRALIDTLSLSAKAAELLRRYERVASSRRGGLSVLRAAEARGARSLRDEARAVLRKEAGVRFAGRVLLAGGKAGEPVIYTENIFVKFEDDAKESACRAALRKAKLEVRRPLPFARNAFYVAGAEGIGRRIFEVADGLLDRSEVEFCHPELVREPARKAIHARQWHLKRQTIGGVAYDAHVDVEGAWGTTQGEGVTIAVIDDGVDIDHEEFRSSGKVVAPRDTGDENSDPRPGSGDDHGTACAGVACADGRFGASGVAPRARLMPIRNPGWLGSMEEAEAFAWAADHGADVISCSWGPQDGVPGNPFVPMADGTRLAIEHAVTQGRNGKGCVILFAAGNGDESVDRDGYASHPKVLAVAACNAKGKRSWYSDFGKAVWCAFPSGDTSDLPGIWTTDRSGRLGYNPGGPGTTEGDPAGNYTNSFSGTSSSTPGAAGVAALVLSRNPELRWDQVRDVLKRCCDRIDAAGGQYDASGRSDKYGYGRLNARKAVELALPGDTGTTLVRTTRQDRPIADLGTASLSLPVADTDRLKGLKVRVNIEHTYIGDLVVTLLPPSGAGVSRVVLHDRAGGGRRNLKTVFDAAGVPALAAFQGKRPSGTWRLRVEDKAAADRGTLKEFTLEMRV